MDTSIYCPLGAEQELSAEYSLEVYQSVDAVNPLLWNKVIPEANLLMQHDYLRMIETLNSSDMQFRYVLVKRNGDVAGAVYFQVVTFHGAQLINYFPDTQGKAWKEWLKTITEKFVNNLNLKLLVSGNVFMTGENGYYFAADIDETLRARIVRKAVKQIEAADKSIRAVLISDLYEPKTAFDYSFKHHGYNEITVESDMILTLRPTWQTREDYLQDLQSKYRVRTKKVMALCAENHVTEKELDLAEIKSNSPRLNELYGKVMARAGFKLGTLAPDFFEQQKALMPNQYHLFAYYKDGEIIGFISIYHIGRRIEVHYMGMDHAVCQPIHLYQHMMYDMVAYGIEHKVERLHFGRTAPEIKSTIGAAPRAMYGYLKHRNPLFNFFIMKPYTARLKPKEYVIRSPFKN